MSFEQRFERESAGRRYECIKRKNILGRERASVSDRGVGIFRLFKAH